MGNKVVKKRHWAAVIYPDSLPADWRQVITLAGIPAAVSPLHDRDQDETGEGVKLKKPHYHLILCYDGPTTYSNVESFSCGSLKGTIPQPLESVRGYFRYLTHKDHPDKAQYDESEIQTFNGFDISDFIELTRSEVLGEMKELQSMIRELDIMEYSDFMDILLDNDLKDKYDVASSHTYYFERYISSRRNKRCGRGVAGAPALAAASGAPAPGEKGTS